MSVTDDIVEAIVVCCERRGEEQVSRSIIEEDYIESYTEELVAEVEQKLIEKGIEVIG